MPESDDMVIRGGIEAVMGMDITHGHFMTLLKENVEMCNHPEHYRSATDMWLCTIMYIYTNPHLLLGA